MIKYLVLALLVSTPAFAGAGSAAKWSCGQYEVFSDKGVVGVSSAGAATHGRITLSWDFRDGENLRVNGRRCKRTQ